MGKFVRETLELPNEGKFNAIIKVNCILIQSLKFITLKLR